MPAAIYGTEMSMGVAEKKSLNVMEIRCLRSMCEVMCMNEVRSEEV